MQADCPIEQKRSQTTVAQHCAGSTSNSSLQALGAGPCSLQSRQGAGMHLDGSNTDEIAKTRPASPQSSRALADLTFVQNKSILRWLRAVKEDIADLETVSGAALLCDERVEDLRKANALLAELEVKVAAMPAEEFATANVALKSHCPPVQQKNENVVYRREGPPSPAVIRRSQTAAVLGMKRHCERNIAYLLERTVRSEEEEDELKVERELLAQVEAEIAATPAEDLADVEARIAERQKIRRT
ncbi:hypothetical protein KFL_001240150 [Klebsormidium nitens]|uniref:Uncharacterized protein n=1 Tax=Klebsormidium nitens TaxID=105231 RepID=A0A1Y1HVX5_KLENI|nr:hypothetical protein KFL_001240150 [Klebsormidium nitens]|eukprot:GAQ82784.1 hypothetical protein KFL_001240150 [Klebsormidium nitens]